ncbi:hypothetical protein A5906_15000 [Bradyrhizobium sacchari]|uniref:DUF6894 domain-containing protein n=1 Tax=Bradyrhizobium sacchari TaxID=1399419 RepID=A0A560JMN4_9BRAD|nr:hypothetical protein [Bradyrhizobium sacchari]OPY94253.1 hypothetical protein A5906_15000 [Bradyrhizobium sacchari]TWB59212.1 hypothetical protein FBZ94_105488 [Bradyrhizobium sacchari]TWB72428.1 hypothetical protein FBZ95_106143 [Bradyrhizobium sacchari]
MPIFYFDLRDGDAISVDEVGMRLPGLAPARDLAMQVLNSFATQAEGNPQKSYLCEMIIEVRDEKGNVSEVTRRRPTRH